MFPRIPTIPFSISITLVMAVLVAGCGGNEDRSTSSVETQPTVPRVSSSTKSESQTEAKRHPTVARDGEKKPVSESEQQQARAGRKSPQGEKPSAHAGGDGEAEANTDLAGSDPIRAKPTQPSPGTDTYGQNSQGSPPSAQPEAGTDTANMSR